MNKISSYLVIAAKDSAWCKGVDESAMCSQYWGFEVSGAQGLDPKMKFSTFYLVREHEGLC